ncbi:MAG: hypothetical protein IJW21_03190 [Clostridia bacterium]|nr:hypothetical protein [Clostridia bacterium]
MILQITEEFRGVNRRTGKRSTAKTDEKSLIPAVGAVADMPCGRRKLRIDAVDESGVTVTVLCENNPAAKEILTVPKGESIVYRPVSFDGGYKYTFFLKE